MFQMLDFSSLGVALEDRPMRHSWARYIKQNFRLWMVNLESEVSFIVDGHVQGLWRRLGAT